MYATIYKINSLFTLHPRIKHDSSQCVDIYFHKDARHWLLLHLLAATYDSEMEKVFDKVYTTEQKAELLGLVGKVQDSFCYTTMFGRLFSLVQHDLSEYIAIAEKEMEFLPSEALSLNKEGLQKFVDSVGAKFVKSVLVYQEEAAPSICNTTSSAAYLVRSDMYLNATKKEWLPDDVLLSILQVIEREHPKNEYGLVKSWEMFPVILNTTNMKIELQICSLLSHALYSSKIQNLSDMSFGDVVQFAVREAKKYAS